MIPAVPSVSIVIAKFGLMSFRISGEKGSNISIRGASDTKYRTEVDLHSLVNVSNSSPVLAVL